MQSKRAFSLVAILVSQLALNSTTVAQDGTVPESSVVELEGMALVLDHEVLHDPRTTEASVRYGHLALGTDSNFYLIDADRRAVSMLNDDGQRVWDYDERGHGPGELDRISAAAIRDGRELFVYDRSRGAFDVFDLEGRFIDRLVVPNGKRLDARSAFFLSSDRLLIAGPSVHRDSFGLALHEFQLIRHADSREFVHSRSFGDTPEHDPRVYLAVAAGSAMPDSDGGFVYAQDNPYSVRKYDAGGELLWRVDDPQALPSPESFYEISDAGSVGLRPASKVVTAAPIQDGVYLVILRFIAPRGGPDSLSLVGEILWIEDDHLVRRERFDMPDLVAYSSRDPRGRLYGSWGAARVVIRSKPRLVDPRPVLE